ncbi:MAG TPA: nuclease A inhibitor family protein [Pyrinomonadaceae bacterium]|jgi:hypothetical protein|nr:nuclease A inhibitor family protein [Pyrinomonadaceae bacterium]
MTKKSKKILDKDRGIDGPFFERLKAACAGWFYMSETDAGLEPFYGEKIEAVTRETIVNATGNATSGPIEEGNLDSFFAHLWVNDKSGPARAPVGLIQNLRQLLEENLGDLKVFRIGRIRIDIYVVGVDREGRLVGIKTRAVET